MEFLIKINEKGRLDFVGEFENYNNLFQYFLENKININKTNAGFYEFGKNEDEFYIFSFLEIKEILEEKEIIINNNNHLQFFHEDLKKINSRFLRKYL